MKQWRRKMVPKIQITTVSTAPAPGCWLPRTRGITHNQSKFGENIYSAKSLASGHTILAKTDHTPGTWAEQRPISGEGIGVLWCCGNRGNTEFIQMKQKKHLQFVFSTCGRWKMPMQCPDRVCFTK